MSPSIIRTVGLSCAGQLGRVMCKNIIRNGKIHKLKGQKIKEFFKGAEEWDI